MWRGKLLDGEIMLQTTPRILNTFTGGTLRTDISYYTYTNARTIDFPGWPRACAFPPYSVAPAKISNRSHFRFGNISSTLQTRNSTNNSIEPSFLLTVVLADQRMESILTERPSIVFDYKMSDFRTRPIGSFEIV